MSVLGIVVLSILGAIALATLVGMILARVNPKIRKLLEGEQKEEEQRETSVSYNISPSNPVKKKKKTQEIPVYCKHCGYQIGRDDKYCGKCGKVQ